MIGALEAIKMNSPCPRDTGFETVVRCSLLVNRLLEGRIIQESKTARDFFYSKTEERKNNYPFIFFFSSLHLGLKKIIFWSLLQHLFNLTASSRSIFYKIKPCKAL